MKIPIYQVDAFTQGPFTGNPAAVCLLDSWPSAVLMQQIAVENNHSETAFVVREGTAFRIRWFTTTTEIDLCGHATLAAAFILFMEKLVDGNRCLFFSASGELPVFLELDGSLSMLFPTMEAMPCKAPALLEAALGVDAQAILVARDYLVILKDEEQVAALTPSMALLAEIRDCLGVIVTAPGKNVDFVSRFFSPNAGNPEDPATGSAHCTLTPYWAKRLNKNRLQAQQLSLRGGTINCELREDGIMINGKAVLYMKGEIFV
ncbi:MAG: PhzF family phenazine biosynthesis protein [Formivibrio sp.]|nr:PhzF family phenazine biosynthesis protein [Formivibrio sp.]